MDGRRDRVMFNAGALFPFVNGSKTFTDYANIIEISDGHIVYGKVAGTNHDIIANISDYTKNTNNTGSQNNNISNEKIFTIPAGSTLYWIITPLQVSYNNATLGNQKTNVTLRDSAGTTIENLTGSVSYNTLQVGTPITGQATFINETDIYAVGLWMAKYGSYTAELSLDINIYCDGKRFV